MNFETLTASLHAGLIQRARPKPVLLRDGAGPARAAPVPLRAGEVPLRAGDIVRARPATAPRPEFGPAALTRALARAIAAADPAPQAAGAGAARRFGLTVRVGTDLRERLHEARERTGRTGQSILEDALAGYLAALERRPGPR